LARVNNSALLVVERLKHRLTLAAIKRKKYKILLMWKKVRKRFLGPVKLAKAA